MVVLAHVVRAVGRLRGEEMSMPEGLPRELVEKWIASLRERQPPGDPERSHTFGDEILCEALRRLGYADLVREWEILPRWYS